MTTWTPIRNYADTYHVLGAGACFVHPTSGNVYFYACEKVDGTHQNLVIYRLVTATGNMEKVHTFTDGIDSQGFIDRGGCVINRDGALVVATSLQHKGVAYDPKQTTGFQGVWAIIPGVDEPWSSGGAPGKDGAQGPPGAPGAPGSGGMQLLPAPRTSPAWENRALTGGVEVDVPAVFGVPSASQYRIRFVASAARADIRIRAGTKDAPFFVTMNTQVANLQDHTTGDTPGPLVYVSVVDGAGTAATARVHLQIVGVWA